MKIVKTSLWKPFILTACVLCSSCKEQTAADGAQSVEDSVTTSISVPADLQKEQDKPIRNVEDIKQAYEKVTASLKAGALDSISFRYSCNGEKGGTVSYFSENGKLRLVVHRYNEYSHFSAIDRYFVKDSTLYFVYRETVLWSFSGPQGATRDSITEQRVYLIDQRPVRCLQKTFIVHSAAADNPRSETIPGKEVKCASVKSAIEPYSLLMKYRNNPTKGCLD